jgi:hypothetical protein
VDAQRHDPDDKPPDTNGEGPERRIPLAGLALWPKLLSAPCSCHSVSTQSVVNRIVPKAHAATLIVSRRTRLT